MTDTPKKISNLKYGTTEEKEDLLWAEVFSHRNKLLLNSDWTQLPDSGLTEECIKQWRDWRQQLRQINRANVSDRDVAEQHIKKLARRTPFITFSEEHNRPPIIQDSLDARKTQIIKYLDQSINKSFNSTFIESPQLIEEQFKEALDFLYGSKNFISYPLILVTAEATGMSEKEVAEDFIRQKSKLLSKMASYKKKYYYFCDLVQRAENDVQLDSIQLEIKKWISTLT